jgi:hypothetical protein
LSWSVLFERCYTVLHSFSAKYVGFFNVFIFVTTDVAIVFSVDARCQVFLPVFDDAASELAHNGHISMAAIDCFDWTDVCQKANISSYPTILIYHGMSEKPVHYKGVLSKKAVIRAMKL